MDRREFLRGAIASTLLLATGGLAALELLGRVGGAGQAGSLASSQVGAPDGYYFVTSLEDLGGLTLLAFSHPVYGNSYLVSFEGGWRSYSSTCTHEPCTVQFAQSEFRCPCHGATFSLADGAVLGGPAPRPLPEYGVEVLNGNLYVTLASIN